MLPMLASGSLGELSSKTFPSNLAARKILCKIGSNLSHTLALYFVEEYDDDFLIAILCVSIIMASSAASFPSLSL